MFYLSPRCLAEHLRSNTTQQHLHELMGVLSTSLQSKAKLTEETGAGEVITDDQEAPRLMLTPETPKQRRGEGRGAEGGLYSGIKET